MTYEAILEDIVENETIIHFFESFYGIANNVGIHTDLTALCGEKNKGFNIHVSQNAGGFKQLVDIFPDQELGDEDQLYQQMSNSFNTRIIVDALNENEPYGFFLFSPEKPGKIFVRVKSMELDEKDIFVLEDSFNSVTKNSFIYG